MLRLLVLLPLLLPLGACHITRHLLHCGCYCERPMPELVDFTTPVRVGLAADQRDQTPDRQETACINFCSPAPAGAPAAPLSPPAHSVRRPGHPVTAPAHSVSLPGHSVALPGQSVSLPGHSVTRPGAPVGRPGHPVTRPGAPVALPGHPVERPGNAVTRTYSVLTRPSHPVTRAAPAR